jgi:hypothetical protein
MEVEEVAEATLEWDQRGVDLCVRTFKRKAQVGWNQ